MLKLAEDGGSSGLLYLSNSAFNDRFFKSYALFCGFITTPKVFGGSLTNSDYFWAFSFDRDEDLDLWCLASSILCGWRAPFFKKDRVLLVLWVG